MPALSEITNYSNDSNLSSGGTIQSSEHNTHRTNVRDLFGDLLSYFADLEQNFSSGSQPTDTDDGKLWYDSTNKVLKLRSDAVWEDVPSAGNDFDNITGDFTTGGKLVIDVDGTAVNADGSITFGAGNDAAVYFDGTNLVIHTDGAGASGIVLDSEDDTVEIKGSGTLQATFNTGGLNLVTGDEFSINSASVLNATTLGSSVVTSSLTTVGALNSGSITSGFGAINNGSSNITTTGTVSATTLTGTLSTAAQGNVTSVGTLTGLTVSGDANFDSGTLFVDVSENKVGVGTTSPSAPLAVQGATSVIEVLRSSGDSCRIDMYNDTSRTNRGAIEFDNTTGFMSIGTENVGWPLILKTNGSEAIRIDSSQNVGIGIDPTVRLHVEESASGASQFTMRNSNSGTGALTLKRMLNDANTEFDLRLDSSTSTNTICGITAADYASIGHASGSGIIMYTFDAAPLIFGTNNIARARIDPSGNFGVGTASPAQKLHVTANGVTTARFERTDSDSEILIYRNQAQGSAAATGTIYFQGQDSATNATTYATVSGYCEDDTNGGEDGSLRFATTLAGSLATKMQLYSSGGLVVGSPTGGDQGAGTVNAQALYDDGSIVSDFVFEDDYNLLSIDEMTNFFKTNKHLPWIRGEKDWEEKGKPSLGQLVNMIYETVENQAIYISELHERLEKIGG